MNQAAKDVWRIALFVTVLTCLYWACGCTTGALKGVDQYAGAVEIASASSYRLVGDLTRQGLITEAQRDSYVAKIDSAVSVMRTAQDTATPGSTQALTIAQGALAALTAIQAELIAKQGVKPKQT